MGFVILRHGEDGQEGDRALLPFNPAGPLVNGGQVGIEVARVTATPRHFFPSGGDLAKGFRVIGHIREDYQNMHLQVKGEVFRGGHRHPRGGVPLNGRVIGQVDKERRPLNSAGPPEIADEVVGLFKGDPHGGKDHGKLFFRSQNLGLPCDLCRQAGMGQARAGKDRQFLATDQGVQPVNGGDPCLDKLRRVVPGIRVHRGAVNIQPPLGDDGRGAVLGPSQTVKDPAQNLRGNAQLNTFPEEAHFAFVEIQAGGALKELHQGDVAVDLQNAAPADLPACQLNLDQFPVFDPFDLFHKHQRSYQFTYGPVFFKHRFHLRPGSPRYTPVVRHRAGRSRRAGLPAGIWRAQSLP